MSKPVSKAIDWLRKTGPNRTSFSVIYAPPPPAPCLPSPSASARRKKEKKRKAPPSIQPSLTSVHWSPLRTPSRLGQLARLLLEVYISQQLFLTSRCDAGTFSKMVPSDTQRPKIFRYAKFDIGALCRLASRLRGGISCDCDTSQAPMNGSLNWAISIFFVDGVEWILRSPLNEDGAILCLQTNSILLESEAVTMKYIKAHSSIPVPEIFASYL